MEVDMDVDMGAPTAGHGASGVSAQRACRPIGVGAHHRLQQRYRDLLAAVRELRLERAVAEVRVPLQPPPVVLGHVVRREDLLQLEDPLHTLQATAGGRQTANDRRQVAIGQ